MRVIIYTDGGCSPNPGLGGWAAVLISPEHNHYTKELSGAQPDTTNNRMELLAAIRALEALKMPCQVELHTDSKYLQHAFTEKMVDNCSGITGRPRRKSGGKSGFVGSIA
jgi:ribonuclease HI